MSNGLHDPSCNGARRESDAVPSKPRLRVALVVNEYFGALGTAYGGYGFLAKNILGRHLPNETIELEVLLGKGTSYLHAQRTVIEGVAVCRLPKIRAAAKRWLLKQRYDIYFSIELTYTYVMRCLLRTNARLLLWIQDPRPPYEWEVIKTVHLLQERNYYKQRTYDLVHKYYVNGRVTFISQAAFLNRKAIDLYGLPEKINIELVRNPIEVDDTFDIEMYQKKDMIIFLGRIESVKRGWLFCEIAKALPQWHFYVLGQPFRQASENQRAVGTYNSLPNLHFVGHVDGEAKRRYLRDAKLLVNTSIHEAVPISFLEALSYGTLIVSNQDPDNLTSRFGVYVGTVLGDGFDKVHLFVQAIEHLMHDERECAARRRAAIAYIRTHHQIDTIIPRLRELLLREAGARARTTRVDAAG